MASTPEDLGMDPHADALGSVRDALPELDGEDLVEQRLDDAPGTNRTVTVRPKGRDVAITRATRAR